MQSKKKTILLIIALIIIGLNDVVFAEYKFNITPRCWSVFYNKSNTDENYQGNEDYEVDSDGPLFGLTLAWLSKSNSHLLTAFAGIADGTYVSTNNVGIDGDFEVFRMDIEYLFRKHYGSWNMLYGGRIFKVSETYPTFSGDALNILGELGVSKSIPLGSSNKHFLFGNLLGMLGMGFWSETYNVNRGGNEDDGVGPTLGIDVNIGYQFLITNNANFNIRYRHFFFPSFDDQKIKLNGPEVGFSYTF